MIVNSWLIEVKYSTSANKVIDLQRNMRDSCIIWPSYLIVCLKQGTWRISIGSWYITLFLGTMLSFANFPCTWKGYVALSIPSSGTVLNSNLLLLPCYYIISFNFSMFIFSFFIGKQRGTVMHFPTLFVFISVMSADAAAPRTFLWQEIGNPSCIRCCGGSEEPADAPKKTRMKEYVMYPMPRVQPRIEMSILKG